jgi:hypothetical protein
MKKLLTSSVGAAVLLGFTAMPASADVTVLATLTKTKDVFVFVDITKDKVVLLDAFVDLVAVSAAEALAIANIENEDNTVGQSIEGAPPGLFNYEIYRRAEIRFSVNNNAGIIELNQDVGNMANQGNVLAFTAVFGAGDTLGTPPVPNTTYVEAEAWLEQENEDNEVTHLEDPNDTGVPFNPNRDAIGGNRNMVATIANSINTNTGIVGVNQNAGNMANQTNVVAMAVGFGTIAALSEAALGQENAFNTVTEAGVSKLAYVADSINGNTGVVHVNQSAGNMANQSNVFALAFTFAPAIP